MGEVVQAKGYIKRKIKYKDRVEYTEFNNKVLNSGKELLAASLLEGVDRPYVTHIVFGDGGTDKGVPKEVQPSQEGLNGVVRIKKEVVAQINPEMPTQAIFSVVVGQEDGNGFTLNEMGLELSNGKLYSLATFANLDKKDDMEIEWSWYCYYV